MRERKEASERHAQEEARKAREGGTKAHPTVSIWSADGNGKARQKEEEDMGGVVGSG